MIADGTKVEVVRDLERAVIALSADGFGYALAVKGVALEMDRDNVGGEELGGYLAPTLEHVQPSTDRGGLWIVDVVPTWSGGGEGEEAEPAYDAATHRRPNAVELQLINAGKFDQLLQTWADVLDGGTALDPEGVA